MNALTVIVTMDPKNSWAHKVFPIELNVIKEQIDTVVNRNWSGCIKNWHASYSWNYWICRFYFKNCKNPVVIDPVMVCKVSSGSTENLFPENVVAMKKSFIALRNCCYSKLIWSRTVSWNGKNWHAWGSKGSS